MKFLVFILLTLHFQCSFANIDRSLKPFTKELRYDQMNRQITIINQIRMYYEKGHVGWVELGPMFDESPFDYFSRKQREIGQSRYQWKKIFTYNVHDQNFQITDVKTDYVFFVSVGKPKSDREEGSFLQTIQVISLCLLPCKEFISLDVQVKLFYKNELISEKKSTQSGSRYLSIWYFPFPSDFHMRDFGHLSYEPSLESSLFLNGFQEAIDEIYASLPNESNLLE